MTILPRQSTDCNLYQNTNGIFHRTRKNNSRSCRETQKILNIQDNLEKEEQAGGIIILDFRLYDKATVIET